MSVEFKSLAEILREARATSPVISPLIAEPLPVVEVPEATVDDDDFDVRLPQARTLERFEGALRRLLEEIAAEVVGRELLLAPIDVDRIVTRLKARFGFSDATLTCTNGDVFVAWDGTEIDASLGRRLRSAIERALA
jgi:hypothetical protein